MSKAKISDNMPPENRAAERRFEKLAAMAADHQQIGTEFLKGL